ncbi:putative low-specificity L-threonine aldolase [Microsporum audouinii]
MTITTTSPTYPAVQPSNGKVNESGKPGEYITPNLTAALRKAENDFRSDVVTVPTEEMMQAIMNATFGDDIYDADVGEPSVVALEQRLVELTGMEAGLWVMSGTMGNQICLRTHLTQPPHTVLLDHRAHIYRAESGALPALSQASITPVHPANGVHLTLEDVKENMTPDGNWHYPPTRVVALENTLSGSILPLKDAKEISDFVRGYPVPKGLKPIAMHCDAARLFDGVAGEGVDLKEYCACFDSISVCLAKGLGAPMGSIILGTRPFIERAKYFKKMFGGGTRQPGMMAAGALAALNNSIPQLPRVHTLTKTAATQLEAVGYKFSLPVQTNMIVLDLKTAGIPDAALVKYCKDAGIVVFPGGRLVFHYQTSQDAANRLVKALTMLMQDTKAGKLVEGEANGKRLNRAC